MSSQGQSSSPWLWIGMAVAILAAIGAALFVVRVAPKGQSPTAARSVLANVRAVSPPGVLATIRSSETSVRRRLPAPAFALEPGQSLDARVPAGPFEAGIEVTFHPGRVRRATIGAEVSGGTLEIERPGEGIIAISGAGDSTCRMSKQLFFPDRLATLIYRFTANGEEPVHLRALWRPDGSSAAMPLPTQGGAWPGDPQVAGLALVQRLKCVACHESADPALQALLDSDPAPVLGRIGERARPAWMRRWIGNPHELKVGTSMPALLRGDSETVEDLVHFLASLRGPIAVPAHGRDEDLIATGRALYDEVGCFACHGVAGSRRNLGPVGEKTTPAALAAFLLDPVSVRPSGRMPSQRLSPMEAEAIASYLIADDVGSVSPHLALAPDPQRVTRGRDAFADRGCAACHTMGAETPQITSTLAAPGLETVVAALDRVSEDLPGCLSIVAGSGVPAFDIDDTQRFSMAEFLRSVPDWACHDVPIDRLGATLVRLNCLACHDVHEAGGPAAEVEGLFRTAIEVDLGDEGRLPPDLGEAGSRLTSHWITRVLEESDVGRPYMAVRMPQFGSAVSGLAPLFAAASGTHSQTRKEPVFSTSAAVVGRELVGAGAFNCIQCHSIAGRDATSSPGPDLAAMPERLHYEYFRSWIFDPKLIRPGTRMPTFFYDGRSGLVEHLEGDGDAQIAAMWSYLSQGEHLPLPEGLPDPGQFVLDVMDRPIVFRTFMTGLGPRAIACGYPEQVHCAFDAKTCSLRLVWTGRFLSAQGAWAARGGSETDPQQTPIWRAPEGVMPLYIEGGDSATETIPRFRGYRLDKAGRPSFLYEVSAGGVTVEVVETPEPVADGSALRRRFSLHGPPGTVVALNMPGHTMVEGDSPVTLDGTGAAAIAMELSW